MPDTLAVMVKRKYPEYADIPDADLESRIMAKFPGQYDDLPRTQAAQEMPPLPDPPSAAGFGANVVNSGINTVVNTAVGIPKLLYLMATDPKEAGKSVVEGIGNRAKEVWNDPLGTIYNDPVGLGADVAGVASLGKLGLKAATAGRGVSEAVGKTVAEQAANASRTEAGNALRSASRPTSTAATGVADDIHPIGGWSQPTSTAAGMGSAGFSKPLSIEKAQAAMPTKAEASPSYQQNMRDASADPMDWHSGAEPGSPEAEQASKLHREDHNMDRDFRRRMMDEKGSVGLDLIGGMVLEELLRKAVGNGTIRNGIRHPVRAAGRALGGAASTLAEPALDMGVIGRFLKDDQQ